MAQVQQQRQAQAPSFREATRQQFANVAAQQMSSFGLFITYKLPQTGYLSRIWLYFTGTITTGAGTPAGSWATYPPMPWALIRRLRVYTSENVELWNVSGWGAMLMAMLEKRVSCFKDAPSSLLNTNNKLGNYQTNSGTPLASTAYTFSGIVPIPIMTDDAMMLGLILTQTLDVRVYVEITTANQADTGSVSGVTLTPAITFYPSVEFFSVPPASPSQPNLRFVQTVLEEPFPISTNGDVIYRPQIGNIYTKLIGVVENNGAQVAPSGITNVAFKYAQTVAPYSETYAQHVARLKVMFGIDVPDGMIAEFWDMGSGIPGILEPRDFVNTSEQTDVQLVTTLSGLTFTAAQIRFVKRQLSLIG